MTASATSCDAAELHEALPAEVDVLIAGYGPVGATLACLLGRYGVRALVVDKSAKIFTAPRAILLDNEALRILQLAGLGPDAFEKIAIPYVRMLSPYAGEFGRINTGGAIDCQPKIVTFHQPELERALRDHAERHGSVQTVNGVELTALEETPDAILARLQVVDSKQVFTVRARYVVGADGAKSFVRRSIAGAFQGKSYAEDWLVVDAFGAVGLDHIEFSCDPRRPSPRMPAPGGRTRWEFMLLPGEDPTQMASDRNLQELLAPFSRGRQLRIERSAVYRFHARCCERFSRGRVFLAGDSAHVTPPFVGQGLVSGLRDAASLAWRLAWVLKGRAAPSILDSYDRERRPHAAKMIAFAQRMGQLVMPRGAAAAVVMHRGLSMLRRLRMVRERFDELGMKPENAYSEGLFLPRGQLFRRGAWWRQTELRNSAGQAVLSDDALGPHLGLVTLGGQSAPKLSVEQLRAWSRAGGVVTHLALGEAGIAQSYTADERAFPAAAHEGWCVVVRPDRTILHDGPSRAAGRILNESLQLLGAMH